ncbi:MAG TPA: hypothetical protein V6D47_07215 [Oscillatoriaceae cyanobacterium]
MSMNAMPPVVTVPVNNYKPTTPTIPAVPAPSSFPSLPSMPSLSGATATVKSAFSGLDELAIPRMGVEAAGVKTALSTVSKAATVGTKVSGLGAVSLGRSLGFSALFAIPSAFLTDFIEWKQGKITAQQRNVLIAADSVGYTASGLGGSALGAMLGTTFLGPGVGTVLGIGAGLGLGWVYEKYIRPRFIQSQPTVTVPNNLPV